MYLHMKKADFRHKGSDRQFLARKEIVRLKGEGKTNKEIAEIVGGNSTHVSTIWQNYLKQGLDGIAPRKRGRKDGEIIHLAKDQEIRLLELILKKCPEDCGISSKLWTRSSVKRVIEKEFGVKIPIRTISDYFIRWQLVPDKPIKSTNFETSSKYEKWLSYYNELVKKSKNEDFGIYWVDSNEISNILTKSIGGSFIILTAISNGGQIRFRLLSRKLTFKLLVKFVDDLVTDVKNGVHIIMYNKEVYQSDSLHEWLDTSKNTKIEIEWLETCYASIPCPKKIE